MGIKLFTNIINAIGKVAGGLRTLVNSPKPQLEKNQQVMDNSYRLIDTTAKKEKRILPVQDAPDERPGRFLVRGRVIQGDGSPKSCILHLWDFNLSKPRELSKLKGVKTDENGCFTITYSAAELAPAGKTAADLEFKVFSLNGNTPLEPIQITRLLNGKRHPLDKPQILFKAEKEETVEITVGEELYKGPSEFENLVSALKTHLGARSLKDLKETEKKPEITILASQANENRQRIESLCKAHQLEISGVAPEVFYALFRKGLPTDLPTLLTQSPDLIRHSLQSAIRENILPAHYLKKVDGIIDQFKQKLIESILPTDGSEISHLGELIRTVLPDTGLQKTFLEMYLNQPMISAEFWKTVKENITLEDFSAPLEFAFKLSDLTRGHLPLVKALQKDFKDIESLTKPGEKYWEKYIKEVGYPNGIETDTEKEGYVLGLMDTVERACPTLFVRHRLSDESKSDESKKDMASFFEKQPAFNLLSSRIGLLLEKNPELQKKMGGNQSDLVKRLRALQRTYRLTLRYRYASVLVKGELDSAYTITRKAESRFVNQYGDKLGGSDSAKAIYRRAEKVRDTALHLAVEYGIQSHRVSMNMAPDGFKESGKSLKSISPPIRLDNDPGASFPRTTTGVSGGGQDAESSASSTEAPNVEASDWFALFGSLEQCAVEEGLSVHGPAAYLVDILHFLSHRASRINDKSAKDILFMRRPDIGEIELNSANITTPVPYVDLVLEALENAVAPLSAFDPFDLNTSLESDLNKKALSKDLIDAFKPPLSEHAIISIGNEGRSGVLCSSWWTIDEPAYTYTIRKESDGKIKVISRSLQTKGSAAERAANPQYQNETAYEILSKEIYPWTLPFNLSMEEVRAYLNHLGVARWQIMETFWPSDRESMLNDYALAREYAREYIGLTKAQADIISGDAHPDLSVSDKPELWTLWGFEKETLDAASSIPDPSDSTRRISSGHWLKEVLRSRVDVFLQQSGLTYMEMLELLDTYYVNPVSANKRQIRIVSTDDEKPDTCETGKLRLDGLDETAAGRIVGFVRLWRAIGWSMRDLDRAITAFKPKPNKLGDDFLNFISHVQRLNAELGISVPYLLSWWADIDTKGYIDHEAPGQPRAASIYDQLFRNRATVNPPDPAFTENPEDMKDTLIDHASTIAAALGISLADLSLLLPVEITIPKQTVTKKLDGSWIKRDDRYASCWFVLYLDKVAGEDNEFTIQLQASDDATEYTVIPDADLGGENQPLVIKSSNDETNKRLCYTGAGKFVRAAVTGVQGANPGLNMSVQVEFAYDELTYELNLKNLSRLHRITSLAKGINLSIREYLTVDRLIGKKPFETTTQSILFTEAMCKIRESGFSIPELDYLLQHVTNPDVVLAPDDESIAAFLTELRSGLQQIATANTFRADSKSDENDTEYDASSPTSDPDGALTRQKLALLNWDAALIEDVIATLNGTIVYESKLPNLPAGINLPNATGDYAVSLVALPANFDFPRELRGLVVFKDDEKKLVAKRFLDINERKLLEEGVNTNGDQPLKDAVANLFNMQDQLQGEVTYENGCLRFSGPMTDVRKNLLESASGDNTYLEAVRMLHNAPKDFIKRAMRTFKVRNFATDLPVLPPEVKFPADLQNKIYFNDHSEPKKLHFKGVMSVKERDTLLGLSNDGTYHDAVNFLFNEPQNLSEEYTKFLIDDDVIKMFGTAKTPNDRFMIVLKKLFPYLRETLSEKLIEKKTSETLQIETRAMSALLKKMDSPADAGKKCMAEMLDPGFVESNSAIKISPDAFPSQFKTYLRLHKAALIVNRLKFSYTQLRWLLDFPATGWLKLDELPINETGAPGSFDAWMRLVDLAKLRDSLPQGEKALEEIFSCIRTDVDTIAKKSAAKKAWVEAVNRWTLWPVADLEVLVGKADDCEQKGLWNVSFPDDYKGEKLLFKLIEVFGQLKRLGISVQLANDLRAHEPTKSEAQAVRQAVRAKYDEAQWLNIAKPLRDVLREKQRAALVSWLVSHLKLEYVQLEEPQPDISILGENRPAVRELQQKLNAHGASLDITGVYDQPTINAVTALQTALSESGLGIRPNGKVDNILWEILNKARYGLRDSNDLYRHYLLDVEMSPCMMTSRIKQAISSVQLFVQRCLMNLEPNIAANAETDEKWLEWKWMKNYRVWEANYKIFLYPENWIEPELRDDKSPFFKELESELLQSDLTKESAETALRNYLQKLDQVAHLEIVGTYHQVEGDHTDILHVFGRTSGTPHIYFYRQRVDSLYWTAWEKLDIGIEGDHLIPVVWNRRLYVFWPVFTEKPYPMNLSLSGESIASDSKTYWEITLAWSMRKSGQWTAKSVSAASQAIIIDRYLEEINGTYYRLSLEPKDFCFRACIERVKTGEGFLFLLNILAINKYLLQEYKFDPQSFDLKLVADGFCFNGHRPEPIKTKSWGNVFQTVPGTEFDRMFLSPPYNQECIARILYLPPYEYNVPNVVEVSGAYALLNARCTFQLLISDHGPSGLVKAPFFYMDDKNTFFINALSDSQSLSGTKPYQYKFYSFYHHYVAGFMGELIRNGVDGLMYRQLQIEPDHFSPLPRLNFPNEYSPQSIVMEPFPTNCVDFSQDGTYALYNFELFFHIPLLVADRLSKNQRYEEAQKWFHYILTRQILRQNHLHSGIGKPSRCLNLPEMDITSAKESKTSFGCWRKERLQKDTLPSV